MKKTRLIAFALPLLLWCPKADADDGTVLHFYKGNESVSRDTVRGEGSVTLSSLGIKVSSSSTMITYETFTRIELATDRPPIQSVNTEDTPISPQTSTGITIPTSYNPVKVIGEAEPDTPTPTSYDLSDATISFTDSVQYTGSPITPTFIVSCSGVTLSAETDYEISSIENNTIAGKGSLTLKGKGNYTGSITDFFTIYPATLTVVADSKTKIYGEENPELTYRISGYVANEDSTVLTEQPVAETSATTKSHVGFYDIIARGGKAQNYKFNYQKGQLTIERRSLVDATLSFVDSCVYTGSVVEPAVIVVRGSNDSLVSKKDYIVEYENNIEPGTARLTVNGRENYTGKIDTTFVIYMKPSISVVINDSIIKPVIGELGNHSAPATFESEQGTIYVSNYYAAAGKSVGLTVTPKPCYFIDKDSITVMSNDSLSIITLVGEDPEEDLNLVRDYRYIVPKEGEVIIKAVFSVYSLTTEVYINGELIEGARDSVDWKKMTYQHTFGTAIVDNAFALFGDSVVVTVTDTDTTLINSVSLNDSIMYSQSNVEDSLVKSNQFKYSIPQNGKASIYILFVKDEKAAGIRDFGIGELVYSIYDMLGRKVDSGFAYGRQDVLDRVKRQPQGLYIIKVNNKTFKVYRK